MAVHPKIPPHPTYIWLRSHHNTLVRLRVANHIPKLRQSQNNENYPSQPVSEPRADNMFLHRSLRSAVTVMAPCQKEAELRPFTQRGFYGSTAHKNEITKVPISAIRFALRCKIGAEGIARIGKLSARCSEEYERLNDRLSAERDALYSKFQAELEAQYSKLLAEDKEQLKQLRADRDAKRDKDAIVLQLLNDKLEKEALAWARLEVRITLRSIAVPSYAH